MECYVRATKLCEAQAEDAALWAPAKTPRETYLQLALRRLHAAIDGEDTAWLDQGVTAGLRGEVDGE